MSGIVERLLVRLAGVILPAADREWMLGDLAEEHARLVETRGRLAAGLWLAGELRRNGTQAVRVILRDGTGALPLMTGNAFQDLRYAVRLLGRSPGFTATVVVTLALGIGANTAIFSVVDALLFRPLPYPHAERLFAVTLASDKPQGFHYWPYPKYAAFARQPSVFEGTAAYARQQMTVHAGDQPRRLEAEVVSASYFPLLGVSPAIGRVFTETEEQVPARDAVVVLSDAVWRDAFGRDANVVGRTIVLKTRAYSIIGVMPPSFRGQTGSTQLWLPIMMADHFLYKGASTESSAWWMRVIARLKPGVSGAAAAAQMPALTSRVFEIAPSMLKSATRDGRELFQLVPFRDIKVDPVVSRAFLVLLASVGFVLLIACANTANLMLGRAVTRQSEFAVRSALGASRGAVVRQVLVEGLLLALISGAIAIAISLWTLTWLATVKPLNAPGFWSQYARTFDYFVISLNPRVAAFNFAVALGVGVLFALLPARQASRVDLAESLKPRTGPSGGFHRFNTRAALALAEISVSLVLLVSAGLMVKSFARATSTDLGFRPEGIVTMTASIQGRRPLVFYRELLQRVQSIPGVDEAALAASIPIGGGGSGGPIEIEGRLAADGRVRAGLNPVTPGFFRTFGIRDIRGRVFTDEDGESAPRAAVINRAFAEAAWPGGDPIGKRVRHSFRVAFGDPKAWTTIVGVVDDVVYGTLEEPREPMLYLPAWQPLGTPAAIAIGPSTIAVRSSMGSGSVVAAVRAQLQALDSSAPLYDIATMSERAANVTARYRYGSAMMVALAALALLLAAIGTYGVIAYAVTSRTREIGIRVALGARPADVLGLILADGLKLTVAGLALGLAGAFAASRVLGSLLYGVTPHDPTTFAAIATLMAAVALLATYLPARRALRVDPVVALRTD
jgi:putative ABC transport system permease protein